MNLKDVVVIHTTRGLCYIATECEMTTQDDIICFNNKSEQFYISIYDCYSIEANGIWINSDSLSKYGVRALDAFLEENRDNLSKHGIKALNAFLKGNGVKQYES